MTQDSKTALFQLTVDQSTCVVSHSGMIWRQPKIVRPELWLGKGIALAAALTQGLTYVGALYV